MSDTSPVEVERMSYQIGMDCIYLRPTPRLAHTEYCSNDALRRYVAQRQREQEKQGNGKEEGEGKGEANLQSLENYLDFDFLWCTNDGPQPWSQRGRVTDMGHADFLEGGTDRRQPKPSPFTDPEEVWAFDAVKEYGLPDFASLVAYYEKSYREGQAKNPNQVVTGGYYKTIVSGAIEAFGWDMLLLAASEPDKFARVLDSFFRLTMHHVQAWAKTSMQVYINHDDMVWTAGPFMHPDFYRQVIFPRYRELWKVLKDAGKKVLYCSDGNFTPFVDDIAAAGADGFIFEPLTSLDKIVAGYGQTHVIIGSKVDCRTLTFGTPQQIAAEVDATLKLAFACPGFMFAVGNHIPSNVPVANAMFYWEYLRQRWGRPK